MVMVGWQEDDKATAGSTNDVMFGLWQSSSSHLSLYIQSSSREFGQLVELSEAQERSPFHSVSDITFHDHGLAKHIARGRAFIRKTPLQR